MSDWHPRWCASAISSPPKSSRRASSPAFRLRTSPRARRSSRALELADVDGFRRAQDAARAEGRLLGFGCATFVEPSPGPPDYTQALGAGAAPRSAQRATARLEPDGSLTVFTSQSPHGQGHHTTLAQLAADELGVPLAAVRVVTGDTQVTPFNLVGTGGSRAATLASGAVIGVAADIRRQVERLAAHLLEAAEDDIELVDGVASVRGVPASARSLAEIAGVAYRTTALLPAGRHARHRRRVRLRHPRGRLVAGDALLLGRGRPGDRPGRASTATSWWRTAAR